MLRWLTPHWSRPVVDVRTFERDERVVCSTDAGTFLGTIIDVPPRRAGYYSVKLDNGKVTALTWGSMQPFTGRSMLAPKVTVNEVIKRVGEMRDSDIRWAMQCLAHELYTNQHDDALALMAEMTKGGTLGDALECIIVNAIGAGKERALWSMTELFDPDQLAFKKSTPPWEKQENTNHGT